MPFCLSVAYSSIYPKWLELSVKQKLGGTTEGILLIQPPVVLPHTLLIYYWLAQPSSLGPVTPNGTQISSFLFYCSKLRKLQKLSAQFCNLSVWNLSYLNQKSAWSYLLPPTQPYKRRDGGMGFQTSEIILSQVHSQKGTREGARPVIYNHWRCFTMANHLSPWFIFWSNLALLEINFLHRTFGNVVKACWDTLDCQNPH